MALDWVAQTSLWTAAARARESARPDRLFEDSLAAALAGPEGFALLATEPVEARDNPYIAIRTRFFDDWLLGVTERDRLRQVVLLGAGMDARAFRLRWLPGTTLYELDRPELLVLKQERLDSIGAQPACDRRPVGVDLMSDSFADHLRGSGFDPTQPSVWLAEGFFEYLDELGAHRVLAALENLTSLGSRLGADFLSRDFLESPWMASYLARLRERGTPWQFGTNEPEVLLERHGWTVTDVRQPGEEGASFGRWPWPVAQRDQPGFPRSFLVTARRQANDEVLVKEASPRITLSASESTEIWSEGGGGLASALPPQMRFTEYDDRYPGAVDCLAESLRSMLPTIRVEHVGSTAVPGLGGRRVLDVVIPAATEEHDRLRSTLLGLGFVDFPFAHIQPLLQGTVRYANEEYPVLLYLLPPDHPYLRGWIACRDYLRGHPDEARRYAEVKRRAIADGQTAPWSYQQAKTPYLEELVKKIEREGH